MLFSNNSNIDGLDKLPRDELWSVFNPSSPSERYGVTTQMIFGTVYFVFVSKLDHFN